jgi:multisubunit Na+/H+ antiporter MnhE subunit
LNVTGNNRRILIAIAAGALVWAFLAANLGEIGVIGGAVFGFAAFYLTHAYLARRAEDRLTREKWKDYE